tara:strand:- start:183 stop:791 length:609 start_codon:yes stop_codon:yes gene_type:complete
MGVNIMKKILIILLLFCNLITNSFSKEIRSRFGFYIDVPDGLTAVQNLNIEELLKDYEGKEIDMNAFNDIMAGVSKQNMNVEYFFPSDLDPVKNAININIQDGDVNDISIVGMKEMCKIFQKEYSRLFNKNIKQYECKQTSEFSPKFNPVIFLIHDGAKNYLIQYQFQVKSGLATLTIGCDTNQNCNTMQTMGRKMIKSINY